MSSAYTLSAQTARWLAESWKPLPETVAHDVGLSIVVLHPGSARSCKVFALPTGFLPLQLGIDTVKGRFHHRA
jgi:hypothetical protein